MKTQKNTSAVVLGACLAAGAAAVQAQVPTQTIDRGIYLGAGIGQSEAKEFECRGLPQCERHGTAVKYFVGYQFARHWSAELGFTDLGKFRASFPGSNQDIKVRLGEITAVGSYPLTGRAMLYGKAGAYYAKTTSDFTVGTTSGRLAENDWGPTWGIGLQYYVAGGFAVRGEIQRYMKVGGGNIGDSDIDSFSIGLLYKLR